MAILAMLEHGQDARGTKPARGGFTPPLRGGEPASPHGGINPPLPPGHRIELLPSTARSAWECGREAAAFSFGSRLDFRMKRSVCRVFPRGNWFEYLAFPPCRVYTFVTFIL
jgi:hypothetical protein